DLVEGLGGLTVLLVLHVGDAGIVEFVRRPLDIGLFRGAEQAAAGQQEDGGAGRGKTKGTAGAQAHDDHLAGCPTGSQATNGRGRSGPSARARTIGVASRPLKRARAAGNGWSREREGRLRKLAE